MHIHWRRSSGFCLSPDLQQYNCLDRQSTGPVSLAWHFGLDTPIAKTRGRWRLLLSQPLPFLCLSSSDDLQDSRCLLSTSPPQLMGAYLRCTGSRTELLCVSFHNHHLIASQDPRLRPFRPELPVSWSAMPDSAMRTLCAWQTAASQKRNSRLQCMVLAVSIVLALILFLLCGWPRRFDRLNTYKGCTARPKNGKLSLQENIDSGNAVQCARQLIYLVMEGAWGQQDPRALEKRL